MSGVVHFKFRSALSYDSVSFDGHYISIAELKRLIADKKGLGADASAELELSDPQTKQPYSDEAHQLPRNSSVVVRRVPVAKAPGRGPPPPGRGGLVGPAPEPAVPSYAAAPTAAAPSSTKAEFGDNPLEDEAARLKASYEDETSKIDAVVNAQDEAWRQDTERSILAGRGGGRGGPGGRGGRGSGRLRPPETYWCKICGAQGQHWVQECPRRHDANLDLKIVRAPAGIPMTLLSRSTEGGLLLPNGEIGVLKHSDDAFEREMAGLPSAEPRKPDAALPALADKPAGDRAPSPAVPALPAPAAATPEPSPGPAAAASRLPVKLEQQALPAAQKQAAAAAAVESRALVLVEPSPGLFDDDEFVDGEQPPVQLGLGMGMVDEQQPDSAEAGGRQGRGEGVARSRAEAGGERSPPQDSDELVPEDIKTLLPMLKGILPRGPLGALLRAFKPGRPLSSEQFAELRADYGRPPPMARAASGQSAGTRRMRSPPREMARHLSPPGRQPFHRTSHDGGFDRDMGFERMPGGRMPGFDRQPPMDRFGAFERQPPFERRWRSRSPTPERSRSRSLSRRERARSPIAPADGLSRPGHRDDRLRDRAGADRHVERHISNDVASWREEPSWREQASWREEPVVKHEHRRSSRSEVEALRQREREGLHSSGDGRHMQDELPHEQRKAHRGDGEERSHKHSRSSKRTHASTAVGSGADAVVANGDEDRAKRRRNSTGTGHKEARGEDHSGDSVDDARWLDTHPSMREASADLANLLDDDDPNGEAPANQPDARDQPREADDSPAGAAATSNPYRRVSRSHSTSPARAADGQHSHGNEEPSDANGGPQAAAAAHDDEPAPVVKQETMDNANQSPKHAEGSSRHRKEKKSSKDKHKSSHKSKKERHKDKHREEDRADGHGSKSSRGHSRHASAARSCSPQPADDTAEEHAGNGARQHAGRCGDATAAADEPARQPSPQRQRAAAAERAARVRSDGPQGLFGKALLGAVGRAGEAGRQLSPSKRRPSAQVEDGVRDGGGDGRTHKRSRRD